jgi:peptidoglycan-associated lipoprotein
MRLLFKFSAVKLAAVACVGLAIAGCAKTPGEEGLAGMAGGGSRVGAGYGNEGGAGFGSGRVNGNAIPGSAAEFAQTAGDRVFFESDSSDLTPKAQATLDRQVAWLQRYGRPFIVEGHADERGTREYNFALGERRATTVKQYLVARGIAPSRIRTISYGKERPVAVCNDISCWSQNRRAVTNVGEGSQS